MHLATTPQRSRIMKSVKNRDTKIETALRKKLWQNGIRYRKNYKIFSCKPDIVITKYQIAIFCDGDFWHGKEDPHIIKTHKDFWLDKIKRNMERDLENTIELRDNGWIVLRFWESDIQSDIDFCLAQIITAINVRRANDKNN